ncbi:MAG: SMP-30/gluconolactonase/LRE family protein [Ktedonobacteraceae bacterium]|nr:SMP-30/gluconolactonase/LRE family protein [Ktedonobacteraceae bacterium]
MSELEHVLAVKNRLGEGPVWDSDAQILYWVDIMENTFYRYNPISGTHEVVNVGVPIGVLAVRASGGLVMATRDGFAFWDERKQKLEFIADPEADKPRNRFNDGAVDCKGRFWAGTMDASADGKPVGALYRLDADGSVHTMETGLCIPNGLGWSPDNTIMYFTDSSRHVIYAYDFDAETGAISNRRTFVQTPLEDPADPDGLTVDSQGYVWSAYWNGAKIVRYAPDGTVERVLEVPALRPTSCVFGGEHLDELYITSSRADLTGEQLEQYPLSGDLFRLKTGIRGLPKYKFAG